MANNLQGLSVSLPLVYDTVDGPYLLNKTLKQVIKQNLKNLILTSPGERIMIPEFGAGVRRYLFESYTQATFSKILADISAQVAEYMPFLQIDNLLLFTAEDDPSIDPNSVRLIVEYSVEGIDDRDSLIITQSND